MRSKPALAECVAGLSSTRSLTVLDLAVDGEGAWAPRAGMSAISTAAQAITQQRALAIVEAFGDLDDGGDQSGFAADRCVALVTAADSALPMRPVVSAPSSHPTSEAAAPPPLGVSVTASPDRLPTDPCTQPRTG